MPRGAPQGENTKGTFVKGHLCAYLIITLYSNEMCRNSYEGAPLRGLLTIPMTSVLPWSWLHVCVTSIQQNKET